MSVMNLSPNFSLNELCKSEAALRQGIENTPSPEIAQNLRVLVENVLQPLRDKFGPISVTSGYRSPKVNKLIGGSLTSDHCFGYAADFEVVGMDNRELALWIKSNLKYTQLILEFYTPGIKDSGWVHCSYNPKDLKQQALTAVKSNGKTQYLTGIK